MQRGRASGGRGKGSACGDIGSYLGLELGQMVLQDLLGGKILLPLVRGRLELRAELRAPCEHSQHER